MSTQVFDTGQSPTLFIKIHGNLNLWGHPKNRLIFSGSTADTIVREETDQVIHIESDSSCQIKIPVDSTVVISTVHGNGQIKGVAGPISIEKIGGNLTLYQVGPVSVQKIYGNLKAQTVDGDLEIQAVYGNLTAQDVSGDLQVEEQAKGNLILRRVGGIQAAALGNATLQLEPQPENPYQVQATGNIHCSIPVEAGIEAHLMSSACQIRLRFPEQQEEINESEYSLVRHTGETRLTLNAKGHIQLTGQRPGWVPGVDPGVAAAEGFPEITDEITGLIDQHMAALEQHLNERLSQIPELEENAALYNDIDEIVEQARQYSTSAALKAQEKAQLAAHRAQAKLARKLESARRKAQRRAGSPARREWRGQKWSARKPSAPPDEPVTDEERLLILKMLEEKKISLEEADQLLAALEGKDL